MASPILGIPSIAPTQTDKTTTMNDMMLAVEGATQDQIALSLVAGDVTLTALQYTRYVCFVVTGQTTARNLIVPNTKRVFIVRNNGGFSVVVKGATGAAVTVVAGSAQMIQNDGINCNPLVAGAVGGAGPQGPPGVITEIDTGAGLSGGPITTSTGTITAHWQLGVVTLLGAGITLAAGTLTATGSGGTVTQVVAGRGLSGGPITSTGTLDALWNAGTVSALGANLTISSGTLAAATGANLAADNLWTAAQTVQPVILTDAPTIAVNCALANNFEVTLGGNRTLANPTNQVKGQAGQIVVIQDATGSRTLALAANWFMIGGGSPSWTATPGGIDIISYYTQASGHICYSVLNNC